MSWIKLVKSVKSCCIRGSQFGSVAKSTRFKLSKIYCIRQNYSQPIPAKFCSKWRWATCDTEKNWFLGESCRRRGHIMNWISWLYASCVESSFSNMLTFLLWLCIQLEYRIKTSPEVQSTTRAPSVTATWFLLKQKTSDHEFDSVLVVDGIWNHPFEQTL